MSAPPGPSTRELYVRIVNGGVDAVPSAAATAGGAQGAPPADAKVRCPCQPSVADSGSGAFSHGWRPC